MNEITQILYWQKNSEEDIETADILFQKRKFKESLFFCHLTIEKALKAHFVKSKKVLAPRTHNLIYLQRNSDLDLNNEQIELLTYLMKFQLEGRYPEYQSIPPSKEYSELLLTQTKELHQCLIQAL